MNVRSSQREMERSKNSHRAWLDVRWVRTNNQFGWRVGEDYLTLNVVQPAGCETSQDLPVIIWIFHGEFCQLSNRDPAFKTSFIVEISLQIGPPVIIFSVNYRMASFRFLWSRELDRIGAMNLSLRINGSA